MSSCEKSGEKGRQKSKNSKDLVGGFTLHPDEEGTEKLVSDG
jgi:hypothetical protein